MRYDDPDVSTSALIGIIGAVLLFVVIVGLQATFYGMERGEHARKVTSQPSHELNTLEAAQLERLNSYGWVNQAEGVVHIPIDRAIELVAAEQSP